MPIVFDGYRPGALGGVLGLHMDYYAREWDFGLAFETKVTCELSEFMGRFDPERDLFLTAWRDGRLAGTVTLDVGGGGPEGAHLRWFMVSDAERGSGLGKQLIARAVSHSDNVATGPIWLTTFSGLDAARALYERMGFMLATESRTDQWQGGVREQKFIRPAPSLQSGEL